MLISPTVVISTLPLCVIMAMLAVFHHGLFAEGYTNWCCVNHSVCLCGITGWEGRKLRGRVCVVEVNKLTLTVSGCGGQRRVEMSGSEPAEDATATGRYCGRLRNVQVKGRHACQASATPSSTL